MSVFCFQDANFAYATQQGILTKIRACEHLQKFCEHEQASTRLIFFEQFEQRPNFASTFKLNGTIPYPYDDEHDARLKQVFNRARKVNLKFNSRKCRIRQDDVLYVDHVLSKEGLKADSEKICAVQEMQPPQDTKELKSFLGFIQYLAKFMPNMASESAPLCERIVRKASCLASGSRARN